MATLITVSASRAAVQFAALGFSPLQFALRSGHFDFRRVGRSSGPCESSPFLSLVCTHGFFHARYIFPFYRVCSGGVHCSHYNPQCDNGLIYTNYAFYLNTVRLVLKTLTGPIETNLFRSDSVSSVRHKQSK